jgi:mono/diheme cytochrome c family protein
MGRFGWLLSGSVVTLTVLGVGGLAYVRSTGLDSRAQPSGFEAGVTRTARSLAIPDAVKRTPNPVAPSAAVLEEAMAHYADHCASCHANDGSGKTEMGQGLFPKAPDMRLPATQTMTDGELFYVIEHGIRFTGMPSWSTGTATGEQSTWHLVHFIRHLPQLSRFELDKMQQLNPRSPEEVRQEIEEERFLNQ